MKKNLLDVWRDPLEIFASHEKALEAAQKAQSMPELFNTAWNTSELDRRREPCFECFMNQGSMAVVEITLRMC